MVLRIATMTAALAVLTTTGGAGVAAADPESSMCNFTLSQPEVVEMSGTAMVKATLTPAACTGGAYATFSQVCLSTPGSAGRCAELPGYNAASVYLGPYRPGVAYTARGRGCAAQLNPPAPMCMSVGPTTVTL